MEALSTECESSLCELCCFPQNATAAGCSTQSGLSVKSQTQSKNYMPEQQDPTVRVCVCVHVEVC